MSTSVSNLCHKINPQDYEELGASYLEQKDDREIRQQQAVQLVQSSLFFSLKWIL